MLGSARSWCRHYPGEIDNRALAEFVREVGVDDGPLGFFDEPHETSNPPTRLFEHRQGDIDPPVIAGNLVQQVLLDCNRRDRGLAEQRGCDRLNLLPQIVLSRLDTGFSIGPPTRLAFFSASVCRSSSRRMTSR